MNISMTSRRIIRNSVLVVLALLAVAMVEKRITDHLWESGYFTGWLLLAAALIMTLFNLRKKITVLPLGSSATWLQFHIYIGWFAVGVFFLHINIALRLPEGLLETVLAFVFWAVLISGMLGLHISRNFPKRLTRRGDEVIFEQIPGIRLQLLGEVESLVLAAARETNSTTIADFFSARLSDFFEHSGYKLEHLMDANRSRFALLGEMRSLERYLNERELELLKQLADLVRKKDDLDYHATHQGVLKLWLFIHIPLTYAFWIILLPHLVVVQAFMNELP